MALVFVQITDDEGFLQQALRYRQDYKDGRMLLFSKILINVSLYLPVLLLSFSDTGVFFGLVSSAYSAWLGLKRGVGSVGSWVKLMQSFPSLLTQFSQHCVSDEAWQELAGGHQGGNGREVSSAICCATDAETCFGIGDWHCMI